MSGGSMNYFYSTLSEYESVLGDVELNDLVHDLVKVFHDKEWWDSADIGEGSYNRTVQEFKKKWFTKDGEILRREQYFADALEELRIMCGYGSFCKDCEHLEQRTDKPDSDYGKCEEKHCLVHGYEHICEKYKAR